jgi:arabinogalactan endo-1,4-beta-galactosidase
MIPLFDCRRFHVIALAIAFASLCMRSPDALGEEPPQALKPTASAAAARPLQFLGADISMLAGRRDPAAAAAGDGSPRGPAIPSIYKENGQESTELAIMINHGWNAFRLRVFLDPVRLAPSNTLENTIKLAKQIKAAGATFLLDIHYSDTWADPQHQETPVGWRNLDVAGLEKQVEEYSADVITQLKNADAMPDMVQVGNEITGGMLWPLGHVKVPPSEVKTDAGRIQPLPDPYDDATQWSNLIRLIKAGTRGVRAASADHPVQIVIHIDCGGDWPITKWYFDHLTAEHVDYDVIGQSFYPNYHGTLTLLQNNMSECDRAYHKPFLVAETGYSQSGGDQIMTRKYMEWPGTTDGQLQFMVDLINTVRRAPNGLGVFYWAPEGRRGNGLWTPEGEPAPSIFVLDKLDGLSSGPLSHLPAEPPTKP